MQKELLMHKVICNDLKKINKNSFAYHFNLFMNFIILFMLFAVLVWALTKTFILGLLVWCIPVPHIIFQFCCYQCNKRRIANMEFTILSQELIEKYSKNKYHPRIRHFFDFRKVLCVRFESGEWEVPDKLYDWSEYCFTNKDDFNDSVLQGDEFYVVLYKNGKIGYVYSKKNFKLIT
ncbi:MAG: hypothetical protein E7667_02035 [Ruminococcaceae bacterium]|nr:hypothetical protein [Oscillospiraceae bacterium]